MQALFWIPRKNFNLVRLVSMLDEQPLVSWEHLDIVSGDYTMEDWLESLRDMSDIPSEPKFPAGFRPEIESRWRCSHKTAWGEELGAMILQPLNRESSSVLLTAWEGLEELFVCSHHGNAGAIGDKLKDLCGICDCGCFPISSAFGDVDADGGGAGSAKHSVYLLEELLGCGSEFVLWPKAGGRFAHNVPRAVVVASHDDALLRKMYYYLVSVGEVAAEYASRPPVQGVQKLFANGLVLDELRAGFMYLECDEDAYLDWYHPSRPDPYHQR